MKKTILILLFLFLSTPCFSQDYWVYIRTSDRSGATQIDDRGRSKDGDVVAILPATPQYVPTTEEKKNWLIIKASNLTQEDIDLLTKRKIDDKGTTVISQSNPNPDSDDEPIAYREYKIDYRKLSSKSIGIEEVKKTRLDVINNRQDKTILDFTRYKVKSLMYAYINRPLIRVANIVIPRAFAETISTINKTGEDYNTITLWEDAKDGDLVTETRQETAELYNDDGTLTDSPTIAGSTTNATYYMKIYSPAGERHTGIEGTGFVLAGSITLDDTYVTMDYLELSGGRIIGTIYTSGNTTISNCLIHDVGATGILGGDWGGSSGWVIYNTAVYNISNTWQMGIACGGGGFTEGFNIYNSVVYNTQYCGYSNGSCSGSNVTTDTVAAWCARQGSCNCYSGFSGNYNASDDTSSPGANSIDNITEANEFVSLGATENFHLKATSQLIDAGTTTAYTTDIDGDTRPSGSAFDIGFDEVVQASGPTNNGSDVNNTILNNVEISLLKRP